MKYIKPNYEKEAVEVSDIVLASSGIIDLGNGVTLTQTAQDSAKVGASAYDVLGIR